jgi:pantoate--beta-alanine ligase
VRTVRTVNEVRAALAGGGSIGLVPTMGALHDGHLSLFRAARAESDTVVASLFVNPAQFDDEADLGAYPRDEARDAGLAAGAGVDLLFAPSLEEMYPAGFQTWVEVEKASAGLEGDARPGHFRAVATVCLKLFNIVRPARAYFGQKDAQQAAVIRRLVRDLDLPLEIRVLPTVRDDDGLALSSRNVLLSAEERARALALPRALARGAEIHHLGGDAVGAATAELNGLTPDYVELLDLDGALVLASAVRVGSIRLIDNVLLHGELR